MKNEKYGEKTVHIRMWSLQIHTMVSSSVRIWCCSLGLLWFLWDRYMWNCLLFRIDRVLFHLKNKSNRLACYTVTHFHILKICENRKVSFPNSAPHTTHKRKGTEKERRNQLNKVIDCPCSLTEWMKHEYRIGFGNWKTCACLFHTSIRYIETVNFRLSSFAFTMKMAHIAYCIGDTNRIQAYAWYL